MAKETAQRTAGRFEGVAWALLVVAIGAIGACSRRDQSGGRRAGAVAAGTISATTAPRLPLTLRLHVEGITCEGCAWQIRETLKKVEGISAVHATVADRSVVVEYQPESIAPDRISAELAKIGYKATQPQPAESGEVPNAADRGICTSGP